MEANSWKIVCLCRCCGQKTKEDGIHIRWSPYFFYGRLLPTTSLCDVTWVSMKKHGAQKCDVTRPFFGVWAQVTPKLSIICKNDQCLSYVLSCMPLHFESNLIWVQLPFNSSLNTQQPAYWCITRTFQPLVGHSGKLLTSTSTAALQVWYILVTTRPWGSIAFTAWDPRALQGPRAVNVILVSFPTPQWRHIVHI